MAYVVARPAGRFEIRESRATPQGPRARTLATFRELDDAVVRHASDRATAPLDVAALVRGARRVGAPVRVGTSEADRSARLLLAATAAGRPPSPVLMAMVADAMQFHTEVTDSVRAMAPWMAATPAERGEALRDLLLLADRLPPPRRERALPPSLVGS